MRRLRVRYGSSVLGLLRTVLNPLCQEDDGIGVGLGFGDA